VPNNQNKKETLYLLKEVTGYFRPQEMAALVRRQLLAGQLSEAGHALEAWLEASSAAIIQGSRDQLLEPGGV
jgi:hypothetical protein